jgi:hypothetical protein
MGAAPVVRAKSAHPSCVLLMRSALSAQRMIGQPRLHPRSISFHREAFWLSRLCPVADDHLDVLPGTIPPLCATNDQSPRIAEPAALTRPLFPTQTETV